MKKLTLLVGALGGTLAGYLFSNEKLREQLAKSKDAQSAAQILGTHLSRDGKKIAKEVQDFVKSDEVQRSVNSAKKYAEQKLSEAKKEISRMMRMESKRLSQAADEVEKSGPKPRRGKRMKLKVKRVG